jgi:hypothetical protein
MRGDLETVRTEASLAVAAGSKEPTAYWYLVDLDLREGKTDPAHVAAAERAQRDADPQSSTHFGQMIVATTRHDWREAARLATGDVASFKDKASPWDLSELDSWLGLALVESNDPKSAIAPLEEALVLLHKCCHDFHYNAPIAQLALARALAATGGDIARARTLAEQARDGFARLGPGRDADRQAAIRWLAAHGQ